VCLLTPSVLHRADKGASYEPQTTISAKRYALFVRDASGTPVLLRKDTNNKENQWSEHGLGHLLNPTDPESDDREWIAQVWNSN